MEPRNESPRRYRVCTGSVVESSYHRQVAHAPEYCPVSIGVSAVGERWNLLILRELLAGPRGFNDIHRGLPGLSRTLLSQRLRTLQRSELVAPVAHDGSGSAGYQLTPMGADLRGVLSELGAWSVRWCFHAPVDDQLDPHLLLWRMRQGLVADNLPARRAVVELVFEQDPVPERGWLILDGEDSSACTRDPRFEVDLYARAASTTWHELWHGHRNWRDVLERDELQLTGDATLASSFPDWFALSAFAGLVHEHRTRG